MESNKEDIEPTFLYRFFNSGTANKMTEKLVKFSLSDLQKDKLWPHFSSAGRIMG
uniref:Uncharacterized protein n=1 Tax=Octopus bimaculoides TaxID=37653 RepID=A0A0L8I200_OCTBM